MIGEKLGVKKRICVRGHDTHKFGRTKFGHCIECNRVKQLRSNMTFEQNKKLNEYKRNRRKNRTSEQILLDQERWRIYNDNYMNDPIKKMLRQTKSRIRYHEKQLKGYN